MLHLCLLKKTSLPRSSRPDGSFVDERIHHWLEMRSRWWLEQARGGRGVPHMWVTFISLYKPFEEALLYVFVRKRASWPVVFHTRHLLHIVPHFGILVLTQDLSSSRYFHSEVVMDSSAPLPTVTVTLPYALRSRAGNRSSVTVSGRTVHEIIAVLDETFPGLRFNLCHETGELRPYVNIFLDCENIRYREGLDTPVKAGATLHILQSVAGG